MLLLVLVMCKNWQPASRCKTLVLLSRRPAQRTEVFLICLKTPTAYFRWVPKFKGNDFKNVRADFDNFEDYNSTENYDVNIFLLGKIFSNIWMVFHRTKVDSAINPSWGELHEFIVDIPADYLKIRLQLMDQDILSSDDILGNIYKILSCLLSFHVSVQIN